MPVIRVEKTSDFTVMSNHHLRNPELSLKAKGLLSQILSLPEGWDYTVAGLAGINKEGEAAITSALKELKEAGYVQVNQTRDAAGRLSANEYIIRERPVDASPSGDFPVTENPVADNPVADNPVTEKPVPEKPAPENRGQLNKDISNTEVYKRKNKKEKSAQLTQEALRERMVEKIRQMGQAGQWSAGEMNQLYESLCRFYDDRPIKGGKNPPVRSVLGLTSLCNKLMRGSGGDIRVILNALDDAIAAGWTTAYPRPAPAGGSSPPKNTGRRYEEL